MESSSSLVCEDSEIFEKGDDHSESIDPHDALNCGTKLIESCTDCVELSLVESSSVISHEACSDGVRLSFDEEFSASLLQAGPEDISVSFVKDIQDSHSGSRDTAALTANETSSSFELILESNLTTIPCNENNMAGSQYRNEANHPNDDNNIFLVFNNAKPTNFEHDFNDIKQQHTVVLSSELPLADTSNERWMTSNALLSDGALQDVGVPGLQGVSLPGLQIVGVPVSCPAQGMSSVSALELENPLKMISLPIESLSQISKSPVEPLYAQGKDTNEDDFASEFDCELPSFVPQQQVHQGSENDDCIRHEQVHDVQQVYDVRLSLDIVVSWSNYFICDQGCALGYSGKKHLCCKLMVNLRAGVTEARNTCVSAENEWENVKCIEPVFLNAEQSNIVPDVLKSLSTDEVAFTEALEYLTSSTVVQQYLPVTRTSVDRHFFNSFFHFLCGSNLNGRLQEEKNFVFCLAACPFNNEDNIHLRVLQTVFKKLTGDVVDCPRYGSHWEQIGFQGENPATDLRSVGFLSLLQLLYLVTEPKSQVLAHDIYKLSLDETQSFPFALMGINLTKIALSALREDCLNKECNKNGSVIGVLNEFYHGMFHEFYMTWRYQHKTIRDSGFVLADLESYAKRNTSKVIKTSRTVRTLNRGLRNADFSNVVELTDEQTLRHSLEGLHSN